MVQQNRKVLIIGLDGATWQVFKPLMEAGELPNISRLALSGASGTLTSVVPPLTAPAWTTFQTGANSGKHGVFDFRIFDRVRRKLWLVSSLDIKLPTLWEITSAADRRNVVINLPVTYPPKPINGVVIGGLLAQHEDKTLVYPSNRFFDIFKSHPNYKISPPRISQRGRMGRKLYIDANIRVEQERKDLALELMKQEEWDVFMIQNQCLDYIQHAYYHLLDSNSSMKDPEGFEDVLRFYRSMDENVGELARSAPSDTDIVVISDHGFKLQKRLIHIAPWLRAKGYMVEEIDLKQKAFQIMRQLDKFKLRRHFAHLILKDKEARFSAASATALKRIDWNKSRAYVAIGSVYGCIYVNLDNTNSRELLIDELKEQLLFIKDPNTGQDVVSRVWLGKDIYSGPYTENGPDIIAEPAPGYTFGAPSLIAHNEVFNDIDYELEVPGGHHSEGIIIWSGNKDIVPKSDFTANLVDIAPTILARISVDIPQHMDGRVLEDLFKPTPEYRITHWNPLDSGTTRVAYSEEEEKDLVQRLSDLGYL
jgi:predicted AlkP superfamily phosphohydrolase/phosphomutase